MLFGISSVHWLVILSVLVSVSGSAAYIRDMLKGTTKPNRVSWSLWALAPIVGSAAALSLGADSWSTLRVFLAGFLPLIVFIASFFNPQGDWKLTRFDIACGVSSLIALVVWGVVDSPRAAILLLALGDGFALLPTLFKAWSRPETETGITYVAGLVSVLLIIPSIPNWSIENSAFQIYLIIANTLLLTVVYRKRFFMGKGF